MWNDLYRRARRLLRPVHPNRLAFHLVHGLNRLGVLPFLRRLAAFLEPRHLGALVRFLAAIAAASRRRRRETRLTVAVDVSAFWEPLTGIGWYLYRLLEHLAERDDLRLRLYGPSLITTPDAPPPVAAPPRGPALELVAYPLPASLPTTSPAVVAVVGWLRRRAARLIAADRNAVLFAPNYFLPAWFGRCDGRLVATVHDLSFRRVPWTLRETTRADLAEHLEATVARAARILTDSETVRGELLESGLVDAGRVDAVPLGPGSVARAAGAAPSLGSPPEPPPGTPSRYVLHVGTLEPRKDLPTLLAAWRRLRGEGETNVPPLVLCGRYGWKSEELRREVEAAAAEGWLVLFGYLDDAAVAALYHHALAVALPTIYEGFGLPALEAMLSGAPLIASDLPVLREVAGDAALFVPPQDPAAWAAAARRLLGDADLRAELARRGRERARRFDWRRTAEGTLRSWRRAAGRDAESDRVTP